jgi:hypothetical protein
MMLAFYLLESVTRFRRLLSILVCSTLVPVSALHLLTIGCSSVAGVFDAILRSHAVCTGRSEVVS